MHQPSGGALQNHEVAMLPPDDCWDGHTADLPWWDPPALSFQAQRLCTIDDRLGVGPISSDAESIPQVIEPQPPSVVCEHHSK